MQSSTTGPNTNPPDSDMLAGLIGTASEAAKEAGGFLLKRWGGVLSVDSQDDYDVKLEVDRLTEEIVLRRIRREHPEDSILSEEAGHCFDGPSDRIWIVDPLDGTVNFFHNLPAFVVSIACHTRNADGEIGSGLVGVVYVPVLDELFTGAAGGDAVLNGNRLALTDKRLSESAISLTLSAREGQLDLTARLLATLARRARKIRSFGATAQEIINVAAGRLAAHVQSGANIWDIAGAAVVLEAAGGKLRRREIEPGKWEIIAANPGVYQEVCQLVDEVLRR